MKFKIDENLPAEVAAQLRGFGHEASTVSDKDLAGAPDTEIVAVAAAEARILITLDKGIANLVRHPPSTHHGVVLFRPGSLGRRSVLEFISDRLPALRDGAPLMLPPFFQRYNKDLVFAAAFRERTAFPGCRMMTGLANPGWEHAR